MTSSQYIPNDESEDLFDSKLTKVFPTFFDDLREMRDKRLPVIVLLDKTGRCRPEMKVFSKSNYPHVYSDAKKGRSPFIKPSSNRRPIVQNVTRPSYCECCKVPFRVSVDQVYSMSSIVFFFVMLCFVLSL